MKIENVKVYNFENSLRGMRNPMNSWDKSDSRFGFSIDKPMIDNEDLLYVANLWKERNWDSHDKSLKEIQTWLKSNGTIGVKDRGIEYAYIGPADMCLAQKLVLSGPEHSKFMRQIFISFDLTAPLYIWKEFDTYKIAVTANSTSTMHKLSSTPITIDCFETGDAAHYEPNYDMVYITETVIEFISFLEDLRQKYLETKDMKYWKELIRWLPESWLQTRTITMPYAVARNMYFQRRNHKLSEWHFITEALSRLPYAKELILLEK